MRTVTSVNNPRVKALARLQRSSRQRRKLGRFCVESVRELRRAIAADFRVREFYFDPGLFRDDELRRAVEAAGADVFEIREAVLEKIAYRQNPQGLVAVLESRRPALGDLTPPGATPVDPLMMACSGLEKPGNVGAILRSAEAAGATAVAIDAPGFDLFNPNCIRASTGAVFSLSVACAEAGAVRDWLGERGVRIVAATPEAETVYTAADMTGPVAIVVGAEAEGLDGAWRGAADALVSVPVRGAVDSLNVSVTAALLLYEAVRQRGG